MITCTTVSFSQVQSFEPIRSAFVTDKTFHLDHSRTECGVVWKLTERQLSNPFHKIYDEGDPKEWLDLYADSVQPSELRFVVARDGDHVVGLATYQELRWNNSLWLLDIRTSEGRRRRGVGSALLSHLRRAAREARFRGISVETQNNNYPALSFYQKHAFEIVGFNTHLYTNDDLTRQDVAVFLFWECC